MRGRLELADEGTSPLVDNVRKLVAQNILRAVSVGFQPIEQQPLDKDADKYFGPFKFTKSELLECSLVAVPANPHALLTAKSLGIADDFLAEVFRKTADPTPKPVHAKPGIHLVPQATKMKPLSERIQDAEQNIVSMRDQLTAIINENESPDESQAAQIDDLSMRIDAQTRSRDALVTAERANAARTPPSHSPPTAPAVLRQPLISHKIEPREHIIRAMTTHLIAKMSGRQIDDVLRERYPGDEGTGVVIRAANAPAHDHGGGLGRGTGDHRGC